MGVAEDDGADAGGGGVQVQAEEFVEDVNEAAAYLHHPGVGQVRGPVAPVGVAPDRVHRGDPFQGAQNLGVADVPGVDDKFHALQGLDRLGAQQAVGVGNDADEVLSHGNPAGQGRPRDGPAAGEKAAAGVRTSWPRPVNPFGKSA